MKRFLLILVLGSIAIVLLAVVGAGIFLTTLDLNDYKGRVEEAVAKATGRHLVFEGDITHSLFPLGLKTGRAYIRDEDIYGPDPLFSVEGVSLKADLSALAQGEILVEELSLNGLALKLAVSATGEKNWEHTGKSKNTMVNEDIAPLADDRASPPSSETPDVKRRFSLHVTSVKADNARIAYRDMRNSSMWDLDKADLSIDNVGKNTEMALSLTGLLAGNGHSANAELQGTARFSSDKNVQADISSLRITNQTPGGVLPELSATAGLFFDSSLKNLSVNDIKGTIDKTPFSGTLAAILPGGANLGQGIQWDIRGELHFGVMDADALAAKFTKLAIPPSGQKKSGATEAVVIGSGELKNNAARETDAGKASASPATRAVQKAPLKGTPGLEGIFAELDVTIERIMTKDLTVEKLTAKPTLDKGKLEMPYAFAALGGAVQGSASAALSADPPSWRVRADGKGLKAERLPMQAAKEKRLIGSFQVKADVSGKGLSTKSAAPTLSGTISADMSKGEVQGFNLIPPEIAARHNIPENFPVERASFSAQIKNGVAVTRDIRLVSPLITGAGAGTVNLPKEMIALDVDFMAHRPPAIPVMVRGSFGAPVYSIDMEKLAVNAAKAGLESGDGKKLLKKLPPEVGKILQDEKLIRGIFGGKKK